MAKYKDLTNGQEYDIMEPYKTPDEYLDQLLQQFHKPVVADWNKLFLASQLMTVMNITETDAYQILSMKEREQQ